MTKCGARGERAVVAEPCAQFARGADVERLVGFDSVGIGNRAVFQHHLDVAFCADGAGVEIVDQPVGAQRTALITDVDVAFGGDGPRLLIGEPLLGLEQDCVFVLGCGAR